jgi:predicted SnoaL-like aldol condensation-catalyzing enzyme
MKQSNAPAQVVRDFQSAMSHGEMATARRLLADDLHFKGPIDEFDRADDYVAALGRLAKIVKGMENVRVFTEGSLVAVFYDLVTNTPAGTSPTAEIYTVRDGKITALQAIFDARPFAAMFGKG